MPYILPQRRAKVLLTDAAETAGELNYNFATVVDLYVNTHGLSYQTINDIVGALEGCKAEFQRRIVGPYEDIKRRANGEVFDVSVGLLQEALHDEWAFGGS